MPDKYVHILSEVKKILLDFELAGFQQDWESLYTAVNQGSFSIIVAGEPARGKSTLINELLGDEILPVSAAPGYGHAPAVIMYGSDPVIMATRKDGIVEPRPLQQASWMGLDNDDISRIEIKLSNEWLRSHRCRFIEWPASANYASAGWDAVLLTVSAVMALSQNEMAFLEQLAGKKVPRLAVVLTHLDQVAAAQKEALLQYVKKKLQGPWPQLPLFVTSGAGRNGQAILQAIEAWAYDAGHTALRESSLQHHIGIFMEDIIGALNVFKEQAAAKNLESEAMAASMRQEAEAIGQLWKSLSNELSNRMNAASRQVTQICDGAKNALLESIKSQVAKTASPKQTAEEDLPKMAARQQEYLAKELESFVRNKSLADTQWLEREISQAFAKHLAVAPAPTPLAGAEKGWGQPVKFKDLNKFRNLSRTAAGFLSVAGYVLLGPLALAVSAGGGVITELIINEYIKDQRAELSKTVNLAINTLFENQSGAATEEVTQFYTRALAALAELEGEWLKIQDAFIRQSADAVKGDPGRFGGAIAACESIKSKLLAPEK